MCELSRRSALMDNPPGWDFEDADSTLGRGIERLSPNRDV
jgi:hypothetical protein